MKNNILITGGSGFIGTNLLQFYIDRGFNVINIDFNPPLNNKHIKYWHNINIENYISLNEEILRFRPDYVIHLAAKTDLNGKNLDDYSVNILGVQNLVDSLKNLDNLKRVIFTSTQLVCYGYFPKNDNDYNTVNYYGESKRLGELIIRNDHEIAFEWLIIRPTSIWGPWFREPYKNFFDMVVLNKYFHIGNSVCYKTYGYIGNSIYQISELLNSPNELIKERVFYIGDEPSYNIEQWVNEIALELGIHIIRMPISIVKLAALFGDLLKKVGISFPMTSFRFKNMTTDNVIDLKQTMTIVNNTPFTRVEGVRITLKWLKNTK